jgi:hypothetical protein
VATGTINLTPQSATLPDGSASNIPPAATRVKGLETAPAKFFSALSFDATTEQHAWWSFRMPANYASAPIVKVHWYANATTGAVIWAARIAAITVGTDAVTALAKTMATATTATTTTDATANEPVETSITLANLDSAAAGDWVFVNVYRDADAGGDTLSVAALIGTASIDYTTT